MDRAWRRRTKRGRSRAATALVALDVGSGLNSRASIQSHWAPQGRRRTNLLDAAEEQAQQVGDGGGAVADEQLTEGPAQRRSAREDAHDRPGAEKRDAHQNC